MLHCVYACIYVRLCKQQNAKNNVFLCPDAVAARQRTEAGVLNATNAISASNVRKVYVCVYTVHSNATMVAMTTMTNVTDFPYHFDYYN